MKNDDREIQEALSLVLCSRSQAQFLASKGVRMVPQTLQLGAWRCRPKVTAIRGQVTLTALNVARSLARTLLTP